MAHSSNKKRQATNALKNTANQNKKSKLENQSRENTKKGGLFDDSDEEMDPNVLESVIQQLNDDDNDDKSASTSNSDSDDMDFNDNAGDDDLSIHSTDIPEIDPVSDLLQDQDQDQSLSESNGDITDESETQHDESEAQQSDQSSPSGPSITKSDLAGKFRNHYMGQMTLAFGSELDTIRQEPGFTGARLNVLIDSLESGITIFSDLEKNIMLANANDS